VHLTCNFRFGNFGPLPRNIDRNGLLSFSTVDFSLTDKHRDILAKMGRIGCETIRPSTGRYENGTQSVVDTFRAFGREGMLNLTIRAEHGGQDSGAHGADPLLYLPAVEESARYCPGTAQSVHIHYHATHLLDQLATPAGS
jgi:alkylation response protein AidB-like acyl-CoA dehydrogenase